MRLRLYRVHVKWTNGRSSTIKVKATSKSEALMMVERGLAGNKDWVSMYSSLRPVSYK